MALEPLKDIQTLTRFAYLLRQYEVLLKQSVEIQGEIASLLERQIAQPRMERELVTGREVERVPMPEVRPIAPTTISEILSPVALEAPKHIRQYDLISSSVVDTPLLQSLEGTPHWMIFNNTNLTYDVKLSFNDKRRWFTLPKDSALNFPPWTVPKDLRGFWYKSESGSNVAVELLTGES